MRLCYLWIFQQVSAVYSYTAGDNSGYGIEVCCHNAHWPSGIIADSYTGMGKGKKNSEAVKFLFVYLGRHKISLLIGILILVAIDSVQLVIPKIVEHILDVIAGSSFSEELILKNSLLILSLAILMLVMRFFWRYFIVRPSRLIEKQMRDDMFEALLRLSQSFFNRTKTGDLMALFVNDINAVRMATGMGLVGIVDSIFLSTMAFVFMMSISFKLTFLTVLPMPLIIIIFIKTGTAIQNRFTDVQNSFDSISSHSQEAFSGIRVIKGFVQERKERTRFYESCDKYVAKNIHLAKLWGIQFPSITMLASLSLVFLFYFGCRMVIARELTIGQFVSFSFYINLLVWPMIAIGWVFNLLARGLASSQRIVDMMKTKPDVSVPPEPSIRTAVKGKIEFRDLSFSYGNGSGNVLENLSFTVPPGGSIGIIGKPGAGKTTIASLICHVYKVDRGRIFIDDTDINDVPLSSLRSAISYVPQDSFLFSDTIRENITFSRDKETAEQEVSGVAAIASVNNDIVEFTDGYQTRIGERGITLSGGQKQRIAIARALLADSSILILDDALSAVDPVTETRIKAGLSSEIRKKTSVIIAHRISTVKDCDQIIVLSDGKIIERGNHGELIRMDGFYARLYELQSMQAKK